MYLILEISTKCGLH